MPLPTHTNRNFEPYYDEGRGRWMYPSHLTHPSVRHDTKYGTYSMLRHLEAMAERFPEDFGPGTTIWDRGGQTGSAGGYEEELIPIGRYSDDGYHNFANFQWYSDYREDNQDELGDELESWPEYPESDEATTQEDLDREAERRESDYLVHLPIDDDEDDDDPIVTNRNKPRIKSQVFKPGVQDFEQTIRDSVGS